jgi:ureidoglycolate lyase
MDGSLSDGARRSLRVVPLTRDGFAPFGDVVGARGGRTARVNGGRAVRHDDLVRLDHATPSRLPVLATYRVGPSRLPFAAEVLECHPASSQIFLPMHAARFLVGVTPALPSGAPDLQGARAFIVDGAEGLHYRAGVWHVPMTALDAEAVFAMLMWEGTEADTVEHRLAQPLLIHG